MRWLPLGSNSVTFDVFGALLSLGGRHFAIS